MPEPMWTIELYEDEHGRCPVAAWLDSLSFPKRSAMVATIDEILAYEGPRICGTRYGRALLRLFFHPHGDRQILVLAGYDKGVRPSVRHQSKQIQLAPDNAQQKGG